MYEEKEMTDIQRIQTLISSLCDEIGNPVVSYLGVTLESFDADTLRKIVTLLAHEVNLQMQRNDEHFLFKK